MKTTELKQGNNLLINDINEVCRIKYISSKYISYETKSRIGRCLIDCLTPIKLSEEILLKCGFKEEINSSMVKFWKKNNFTIYHEYYKHSVVDDLEWFFLSSTEFDRLRIYSLHQLQNLYFALTNEELTVNL